MAQLVDWDLATATAAALGKAGPRVTLAEATDAVRELRRLTDEAAGHVTTFTGLTMPAGHPPVRVVDRRDWAATNIAGLRNVIAPMLERLAGGKAAGPVLQAVGSRVAAVQAGSVLAYLSGRILGQYEVFDADPGQLLLVAPNIVDVERRLDVDPRDFRLWVCLHEVTHQTQFTAVPWLRAHFLSEVAAFVDASEGPEELAIRIRRAISGLNDAIRRPDGDGSVIDLVATPAQREILDRITALMTLLEGHAEYVMDEVGPAVIPSVATIRRRFDVRRHSPRPWERTIRRLLGVDVKLRQYAQGRAFVHAVVDQVGMARFNSIFDSPEQLPRLAEIVDPQQWIARVHPAATDR